MTELLDLVLDRVQTLAPDVQDDIARMVLAYVGVDDSVDLTPDEEAAVLHSRAASARGDFATDDEIRAIWAKHGL